jgi:hypothetical protein
VSARLEAAKWRKRDFTEQYGVRIEVHVAREPADQDDGNAEERGKDDADRCIFRDQASRAHGFDQRHREHAGGGGGKQQPRRCDVARDQKREHDAEQHGVADRIAHQCHAAEHEKYARQRTAERHHHGHELDLQCDAHGWRPACSVMICSCSARRFRFISR